MAKRKKSRKKKKREREKPALLPAPPMAQLFPELYVVDAYQKLYLEARREQLAIIRRIAGIENG